MPTLYTIGFTGKSAEQFFGLMEKNGVRKVYDTRLHNTSQLSAFAKGKDLTFFLRRILDIPCVHRLDMAPSDELLSAHRAKEITWESYAKQYRHLIEEHGLAEKLSIEDLDGSCLLCSEHSPERCHRRILAEYLLEKFTDLEVRHLM